MKVRIRFGKHGKIRYVSHRDTARIWERALRKADLAVAYSQGFSPRPRIGFGLALSVGYESDAEYLDVDLAGELPDLGSLPGRLTAALPSGLDVTAARVLEPGADSLQQIVTCCTWRIVLPTVTEADARRAIEDALARPEIVVTRTRKGKEVTDDLRPGIRELAVTDTDADAVTVTAELGTQPRALRPSELMDVLGWDQTRAHVCRTHQWIEREGAPRTEPVPLDAPDAPHEELRAS